MQPRGMFSPPRHAIKNTRLQTETLHSSLPNAEEESYAARITMVQKPGPRPGDRADKTQDEARATNNSYGRSFVRNHEASIPIAAQNLSAYVPNAGENLISESRDTIHESTFPRFSRASHARMSISPQSSGTHPTSPVSSRPVSPHTSSRPSLHSSRTSASATGEVALEPKSLDTARRPYRLSRFRSSTSTIGTSSHEIQISSVHPSDFQIPPEQPEKHFIDSIGMVIPGVCNRNRCSHPLAHFVTHWRLCDPIEYTTSLADHGITYTDYCRLTAALSNFVDEIPIEQKRSSRSAAPWWQSKTWNVSSQDKVNSSHVSTESAQYYEIAEQQALRLNQLLKDISENFQRRGVTVMVCISSFSLFTPNRILEAHVQILHVTRQQLFATEKSRADPESRKEPSFIDPFAISESDKQSVARPRLTQTHSHPAPSLSMGFLYRHHQTQQRDRTRPYPFWPNSIPSRKRVMVSSHADRYGVDPYFRAWMRASINSSTTSTSYANYMIEQENNHYVNARLDYVPPPSRRKLLWSLLTAGLKKWKMQHPTTVNRSYYEHNRRLECRKMVERGSRLRLVRFGFRHPLHPPHTPEMEELGLTEESYQAIIDHIEGIKQQFQPNARDRLPRFFASWTKLYRASTEDALTKVSEYIRQLNAVDRRVVWTIEKIPGVYDRGFLRDKKEWEISAWNGEDPLELLIELERWGVIEKKLNIDFEDDESNEINRK